MQTLTYSSNDNSKLNQARRSFWTSRYMLGCSNREPAKYDSSLWMWSINTRRNELRKVAHELRAKLPAKKAYYVTVAGEVITFSFWVRAHTRGQAMAEAKNRHPHFTLESVELLK